jgi:hypothetical protein
MAAPPLIDGFMKLLFVIRSRPLRVGRQHVSSVGLESRQVGVRHLLDAVA